MHFYENPEIPMMFDLSKDPGDESDIAKQNPETHQRLFKEMMSYLGQVGARTPKKNPDYDPKVYKKHTNYAKYMRWVAFEGKRELEADE